MFDTLRPTELPAPKKRSRHSVLEARSLRWRHGERWIVDDVSLTARSGEIVGLLGPNGAGKTVTLTMLAGLLRPTSGHIVIDDVDITDMPMHQRARHGLGYLPQEHSIFTKMNARENIAAIFEARGAGRREARHSAEALLERFGLTHVARSRAARLSGGEQRRLEVARSLASEPHFLLFDEPFAGVDPITIESLHEVLVELERSGVGVLLTDHNVRETLELCDRAYVLFNGRVLREGTPQELVTDPDVRRCFLGDGFDVDVSR
jgi:lipopolysaccharide export system ATP-binding protein